VGFPAKKTTRVIFPLKKHTRAVFLLYCMTDPFKRPEITKKSEIKKVRVFLAEGKTDLLNYQNKNMPEGIYATRGWGGGLPHGGFPQRTSCAHSQVTYFSYHPKVHQAIRISCDK
jgi:hypothetical protein